MYINAYTGREANNYSIKFFSEDVLTGLEIVSNIVLNSISNTTEIELERGVILQEIGMSLDITDD